MHEPKLAKKLARPEAADHTGHPTGHDRDASGHGTATPRRPASGVQRKLKVGASDDSSELAADRVAQEVVARLRQAPSEAPESQPVGPPDASPPAGSVGARDDGGPATERVQNLVARAAATGRPLPGQVRSAFETAMGADLGGVRVHTGAEAAAANRSINAKAFTVSSDIFFSGGLPDTAHADGQALMAHELAHTLQQRSDVVGRVLELADPDGGPVIDVARINDPSTTLEQLNRWKGLLGWEDTELETAIEDRIAAIEAATKAAADKAADKEAVDKAAKAKEDADNAAAAEKIRIRQEVETAIGQPLTNYDETVDRSLRATFKDTSYPAPLLAGHFFQAAAATESARSVQEVLAALLTNEVALEAFIYANGGLNAPAQIATTVADALKVATAWTALGERDTALKSLNLICAQIKAGRIHPIRDQYRKATLTSTSGLIYNFGRLERKRAQAEAEVHLHLGRKGDLNNSGLKNRSEGTGSDRAKLTPKTYQDVRAAILGRGLWQD
ncbi:MAG: hypothetical protein QOE71_132 [Pseudonocardiales bacterium]|nr:hypothetical protein [Pseudonocardiales bacterium]